MMTTLSILAYIDPASGVLLLQALIAGLFAGFAFFAKPLRRSLRYLLGRRGRPKDDASRSNEQSE